MTKYKIVFEAHKPFSLAPFEMAYVVYSKTWLFWKKRIDFPNKDIAISYIEYNKALNIEQNKLRVTKPKIIYKE